MINLWEALEEEKKKTQIEKQREIKEKTIKKQYNEIEKEFDEAFAIVQINYIFYCFLLDIFPRYIKTLIENNHDALLNGNRIKGEILFSLEDFIDFLKSKNLATNFLAYGRCLTDEMIYYFEDNNVTLKFKDKLIYDVFKEKLNQFLIKNNIISVKESKNSNIISYANPIYFEANIEDLIKAYEYGIKQIVEEKEDLKILMDTWNIQEYDIIYSLDISPKYYKGLLNSARKSMQLKRKK